MSESSTNETLDLDTIEAQAKRSREREDRGEWMGSAESRYARHVPALVAEVRRLRAAMLPLCAAARAAVNGIEPMAASVDDLLCDLKKAATKAERVMAGIDPDAPEGT